MSAQAMRLDWKGKDTRHGVGKNGDYRMLSQRMLSSFAAGLVCAVIAASAPSLHTASAQGLKAPDDPFGDIDLESLKRNGKGKATGRESPAETKISPPAQDSAAAPDKQVQREVQQLFNNSNGSAVANRPPKAMMFRVDMPTHVTTITTYHWNNGRGTQAAGTIAVRSGTGEVYGPWQATGRPGQGGIPNAYWIANPEVTLPAGTYTVIDSSPATWAHNAVSGGAGMAWAEGYVE